MISQVHFRAVSEDLNLLAGVFHIHLAGQSVIFWHSNDSPPHPQHCTLCTYSSEDASEGESCGTDFLQPLKPVPEIPLTSAVVQAVLELPWQCSQHAEKEEEA